MQSNYYPPGTVRELLQSALVTEKTRAELLPRLEPDGELIPRVFDDHAFRTLRAACARIIPQLDRPAPIELALRLDERLAAGVGDGWRYGTMPPDTEAHRRGLAGLDESGQALFGADFATLDGPRQDEILRAVQRGEAPGVTWTTLPGARYFEELLAELVECYYSHPLSLEEIGYVGMADAWGWQQIGLDQLEPWEPRALDDVHA